MRFFDKLETAIADNQSLLYLGLDPNPEMVPSAYWQRGETGIGDWLESVIAKTAGLVCAYKLTLGFYQVRGAPGMALLEQILGAIPTRIPIILDAKHSDLNTSSLFAQTVFEQWQVDAVTLNAYAGQDHVAPFLVHFDKAVFILCRTSNPSAVALQEYPSSDMPFYLQLVKESSGWGTPEQVGLEVGTTEPEILAQVRATAPERLILLRSIWQEGVDLDQLLGAGFDDYGEGLLIPVPQDLLAQDHLVEQIQALRQAVNQARTAVIQSGSACNLWVSNLCTLNPSAHTDLILQLYDIGCILFGRFVQASGAVFPYYIDLRKIISNPQVFHTILRAYAEILKPLDFDRIAGIPYGSLPTATGLALHLNRPMIFPRKEVKAHGTRRLIEGNFQAGETVVVVDDILISGNSAMEGAAKLESAGLKVNDIVVFLDHEGGVKDRLQANGYQAHSVLAISEITETLYQANRIDQAQLDALTEETAIA